MVAENKYCTEKDDRLPHQNSRFFIASKQVGLALGIWPSRKAIKGLLQNIYLILDLVYEKRNPFFRLLLMIAIWEKNVTRRYYFYLADTIMKL